MLVLELCAWRSSRVATYADSAENSRSRFRLKAAAYTLAFILFLALLFFGQQGKQRAFAEGILNTIRLNADQLQVALNDEATLTKRIIVLFVGASSEGVVNPQAQALLPELKGRVQQLEQNFDDASLSEENRESLRVSKATIANAERRFADALALVGPEANATEGTRLIEVRADAYLGLRQWSNALTHYKRVFAADTNQLSALARLAECEFSLGRREEAVRNIQDLVKKYGARGDSFVLVGKGDPALAVRAFDIAIQLEYLLVEHAGHTGLAVDLAKNHNNLGVALLVAENGDPQSAVTHLETALQTQSRIMEQAATPEIANAVAITHHNLANCYFFIGNIDAAIAQYEKALAIPGISGASSSRQNARMFARSHQNLATLLLLRQKREEADSHFARAEEIFALLKQGAPGGPEVEAALNLNNRGVLGAMQGNAAAIAEYDAAIERLNKPAQDRREPGAAETVLGFAQSELDAAIGYTGKSIDLLTRTRVPGQGAKYEALVALAIATKNRGFALLPSGQIERALQDLENAIGTFKRLVEQERQDDLVPHFAKSLSQAAWVYSSNSNAAARNGAKAREYAAKACELTKWENWLPIDALAAAYAETGDFAAAIKWQEAAMRIAPANQKNALEARRQLYASGQPCRSAGAL